MSQDQHKNAELGPPDTEDDSSPLVQRQGVNAGTDDDDESRRTGEATDHDQGDPSSAPDIAEQIDGPPSPRPSTQTSAGPDQNQSVEHAQQYGSGGQDAGNMD